jgi:oligoendopeptidase F
MRENLETVNWDLSRLYKAPSDPAIDKDLNDAREQVRGFRERYYGKLIAEELTAAELHQAVAALEDLQDRVLKTYWYAQLLFSADTETDAHKALLQRIREFFTALRHEILFFDLEVIAIPDERFEKLLSDPLLPEYRHYLRHVRVFKPYTLSEQEEQLVNLKDLTGKNAFVQLFEELTASFRYRLDLEGEERDYTGEELLAMLHRPEADIRERAFSVFLERHGEHALVLSFVFNNILLDHGGECRLRGYEQPIAATHLTNELTHEAIEGMMQVSEENYGLAQEYFRLKAQLLDLPKLKNSDVYAPVAQETRVVPFPEARDLVLRAYRAFSPVLGEMAEAFFTESRIDASVRPGKTGGAFCAGLTPTLPPYVLMNYTGTLRDVATLAHELGHGIHFTLSGKQHLVNYNAVLPMAETASVFGEMLLTTQLLSEEQDLRVRMAILCAKIEDIIATTFRQNVLTRFELKAHDARGKALLTPEIFCDLWWEENARLYGDAVTMIPPYRWGWSYISHFIHSRFYCYSYVFGELLVLSLFQQYRQDRQAFVPRYLELLSAGGSDSPPNLLACMGIDVNDRDFWQEGYNFVRDLVCQLNSLITEVDGANHGGTQ